MALLTLKTLVTGLWMLTSSKKSLHSGAFLPLTVLQATQIIYLTVLTLCCGAQVQSVSMRLLKEIDQNILIGASHLSTWFHRSYPSFGNSVQPPSLSYLSGHLALGGLYCLKDSTPFFCTRLSRATTLRESAEAIQTPAQPQPRVHLCAGPFWPSCASLLNPLLNQSQSPPMLAGHRCTLESDVSKFLFGKCPAPNLKAEYTYTLSCISQSRCQKTLLSITPTGSVSEVGVNKTSFLSCQLIQCTLLCFCRFLCVLLSAGVWPTLISSKRSHLYRAQHGWFRWCDQPLLCSSGSFLVTFL